MADSFPRVGPNVRRPTTPLIALGHLIGELDGKSDSMFGALVSIGAAPYAQIVRKFTGVGAYPVQDARVLLTTEGL